MKTRRNDHSRIAAYHFAGQWATWQHHLAKTYPVNDAARVRLDNFLLQGNRVLVPAITDYELRRELRLNGSTKGLQNLNQLRARLGYIALTEAALEQATEFWALARLGGMPTADRFALDADVILAGQAATLDPEAWGLPDANVIIATTNVGHLSRLVTAQEWAQIAP